MLEISIFIAGVLITIIAFLMLFRNAYQQNKIAALVSLVLIFPLVGYLLFNLGLTAVRKAGAVMLIGVIAIVVSIYGGVSKHIYFLEENKIVKQIEDNIAPKEEGPLPNEREAESTKLSKDEDYDPLLTGTDLEDVELEELLPEPKPEQARSAPVYRYKPVTYEEVQYAINKPVRVTMNDGAVIMGELINVEPDSLMVESLVSGGSVALSYLHTNIKSVEVRLGKGEALEIPPQEQSEELMIEQEVTTDDASSMQSSAESAQEKLSQTIDEVEVGTPEQVESLVEE
jgi:hypothetical protein